MSEGGEASVPATRRTTTARGLGWTHQQRRTKLLARHVDGAPCPCGGDCGPACPCTDGGLPMYRDPRLNIDGMALEADHTIARSRGGANADRLLLATCNRSRGAGGNTRQLITSREW